MYTSIVGANAKDDSVLQKIMGNLMDWVFSGKSAKTIVQFKGNYTLSLPKIHPRPKTKEDFNISQIMEEASGIYYTDLSKNVVYNDINFEGKDIIVMRNISDLKWNITNETKVIKGFKAIKATAKYKLEKDKGKLIIRTVTAWFTDEVTIKVAPRHFYGLPGLVVMLDAEGTSYVIESISNKKININYKLNPKKVISEDDYINLTNEYD